MGFTLAKLAHIESKYRFVFLFSLGLCVYQDTVSVSL